MELVVVGLFAALVALACYVLSPARRAERLGWRAMADRGWPTLPVLGDVAWVKSYETVLLDKVAAALEREGGTVVVHPPLAPPVLMSSDASTAEYILKTNFKNYIKGPTFKHVFQEFLGDGIFNSDGAHWKAQRQSMVNIFSNANLRRMARMFSRHGVHLCDILERAARSGEPFDLQWHFAALTLDSTGEFAMGFSIDTLSKPNEIGTAVDAVQTQAEARYFLGVFWPLVEMLPLPSVAAYRQHIQLLTDFCSRVIRERRVSFAAEAERGEHDDNDDDDNDNDDNDNDNDERENAATAATTKKKKKSGDDDKMLDLITFYLRRERRGDTDGKLDDSFFRDQICNAMIAGRDTTAQTLTWLFVLLMRCPDKLRTLQAEIDRVYAGRTDTIGYDSVRPSECPYLAACVNETLRLYPPVPIDPKQAVDDDRLPNGTFVPKGTIVSWAAWPMHRRKDYWGDDALEFVPERWLVDSPPKAWKFLPFQGGPRICLGQQMAYIEVRIVAALVLQRFEFALAPGVPPVHYKKPSVTLPAVPFKVMVRRRKHGGQ